jgi:hypothetical protein
MPWFGFFGGFQARHKNSDQNSDFKTMTPLPQRKANKNLAILQASSRNSR